MSQSPRHPVPPLLRPQEEEDTPLPLPLPPTWKVQQTLKQPAAEILEEQTATSLHTHMGANEVAVPSSSGNSFSTGILSLSQKGFYCYACFTVLPGKCYLFYIRKILGIFPRSPDLPRSYSEQRPYTGQHRPASSLGRILYFLK